MCIFARGRRVSVVLFFFMKPSLLSFMTDSLLL